MWETLNQNPERCTRPNHEISTHKKKYIFRSVTKCILFIEWEIQIRYPKNGFRVGEDTFGKCILSREKLLLERFKNWKRQQAYMSVTKTELPGQGVCTEMTDICHEYMKSLLDGSVHNFIPSDQGSPFGLQETWDRITTTYQITEGINRSLKAWSFHVFG